MFASEHDRSELDDQPGPADALPYPIEREACGRLRGGSYSSPRDVTCEVAGDVARLGGRLPSQYLRQVAHAIVDGLEGVRTVLNQIEVIPRPTRAATLPIPVEGERGEPSRHGRKTRA